MDAEIWKPVRGFEGFYEVSNHGRVRSLDRWHDIANKWGGVTRRVVRGHILRPGTKKAGYRFVGLAKDAAKEYRMVPGQIYKIVTRRQWAHI